LLAYGSEHRTFACRPRHELSAAWLEFFKADVRQQLSGQHTETRLLSFGRSRVPGLIRLSGGEMVGDHAVASSIENDDYYLENRLREATAEDSRQLLEEFLKAFYPDKSEVAVAGCRPSAPSDPERRK
jgi:hypothetical protein